MIMKTRATPRNLSWSDKAIAVAIIVVALMLSGIGWDLWNQHQESHAQGAQLTELTKLAKADTKVAKETAANQRALKTLLTDGKTTSAVSAKATEKLAQKIEAEQIQIKAIALETQQVIKAGKSAGAESSHEAAVAAAKGVKVLNLENAQLRQQFSAIAADIIQNRQAGLVNRGLTCQVLTHDGITSPAITAACATKT